MKNISYTGGQIAQLVNLVNQQEPSDKTMGLLLGSRVIPEALKLAALSKDSRSLEWRLGMKLTEPTGLNGPAGGGGGVNQEITNYLGINLLDVLSSEPRPVGKFIADCEKRYKKVTTFREVYTYRFDVEHTMLDVARPWPAGDKLDEHEHFPGTLGSLIAAGFGRAVEVGHQAIAHGTLAWNERGWLVAPRISTKGIDLVSVMHFERFLPMKTTWMYEKKAPVGIGP
jgi:hypothetical protein